MENQEKGRHRYENKMGSQSVLIVILLLYHFELFVRGCEQVGRICTTDQGGTGNEMPDQGPVSQRCVCGPPRAEFFFFGTL